MSINTKTYCNPLPLPDYPRGGGTYGKKNPAWDSHWTSSLTRRDFRETADPTVLYHEGRWYLYPSCGMAYVSADFINWEHHRIEPENIGYAPTVVFFRDRFYMTACGAPLYVSDSPLGPFEKGGPFVKPDAEEVTGWNDPMLFADDDARLYAYWGISDPGIFGAELDPEKPNRLITRPQIMFRFDPSHVWERVGDFNEDASRSYLEGPWMFKHRDRYFLTYAGPGTEWKTYAMGTYVSDKPLGPFVYQKRNPILRDTTGLVHAPGHGCVVNGPKDTVWAFYTCLVRNEHIFERRVGMDPAGFDENGDLFVLGASEIPQRAPGSRKAPEKGNDAGLLPVTVNKPVIVSSEKYGREGAYALDNTMRTWWEPADDDKRPALEIVLQAAFTVSSLRVLWKDVGLDYQAGVLPGPFRYLVEVKAPGRDGWSVAVDRAENDRDMMIEFIEFDEVKADRIRLTITGTPKGIRPGLIGLTVFGIPG